MPRSRAAAATWNGAAELASTSTWPLRRCSSTILAHLGIDEGLDLAQVEFLAQRIEIGHALALPLVHAARDQLTVVDAPERGLEQRDGRAGDRDGADLTTACALLEEREDRIPGNEGAVKVEDRSCSSHVRGLPVRAVPRVPRDFKRISARIGGGK